MAEKKTRTVVTGKNILTGQDSTREEEIIVPKDYSGPTRKAFTAHTAIEGSVNGRPIKLKPGDVVHLNVDEAQIFRNYIN